MRLADVGEGRGHFPDLISYYSLVFTLLWPQGFSPHSPDSMLGRRSLRGEAGDSPSEDASSCLTEGKMLVLGGGPVGETESREGPSQPGAPAG